MKASLVRLSEMLLVVVPLTVVLFGCVGYDDGYDGYGGGAAVGPGYYEPYGAYYGGWAPGYYVAPYRNGYVGGSPRGGIQSVSHAYRAAPASRAAPSIPSASRSGGSRVR